MTPNKLAELLALHCRTAKDPQTAVVAIRYVLALLATNVCDLRIGNEARVLDVGDFHAWLRDALCEARSLLGKVTT